MDIIEKQVEELKAKIETEAGTEIDTAPLERMKYRLSDAIREGSSVSSQAYAWNEGESMCALSAGVVAAKARGYM